MKANCYNLNLKAFILLLVAFMVLFSFPSQSHYSVPASDDYVTIQEDKFYLHGEPFVLKGFNYFPRNSLRQSMEYWNWDEVDEELKLAQSLGSNTVRTFIDYGFSVGHEPLKFDEQAVKEKCTVIREYVAAIDTFLSIASKHQLKVIFSIFDYMPGWAFLKDTNRVFYINFAYTYIQDLLKKINQEEEDSRILGWDILNEGDLLPEKPGDPKDKATFEEVMKFWTDIRREIKKSVNKQFVTVNFANIDLSKKSPDSLDFISFQYFEDQAVFGSKIRDLKDSLKKANQIKPIVAMEIGYHSSRRIYEKDSTTIRVRESVRADSLGKQISAINSYLDVLLNYDANLAGVLIWALTDFTLPSNGLKFPDSSWCRPMIYVRDTTLYSNDTVFVVYDNFHGIYDLNLQPKPSAYQVSKYFNNEFSKQYRWDFKYTAYDTNTYTPETKDTTDLRTFGVYFIGPMKFVSKEGVVLDSIVFGSSDPIFGANQYQGRGWYSNEPGYGTTCQWAGNREKVASIYYHSPEMTDAIYISLASKKPRNKFSIYLNNIQYTDDTISLDVANVQYEFKVTRTSVTIHDDNSPRTFALYQNYPNPFNPSTIIKYQLPKSEHVRITIFNILGQQVRLLVDTKKDADIYSMDWDGCDEKGVSLASGVYLCRMEASNFVFLRKMLIIR